MPSRQDCTPLQPPEKNQKNQKNQKNDLRSRPAPPHRLYRSSLHLDRHRVTDMTWSDASDKSKQKEKQPHVSTRHVMLWQPVGVMKVVQPQARPANQLVQAPPRHRRPPNSSSISTHARQGPTSSDPVGLLRPLELLPPPRKEATWHRAKSTGLDLPCRVDSLYSQMPGLSTSVTAIERQSIVRDSLP